MTTRRSNVIRNWCTTAAYLALASSVQAQHLYWASDGAINRAPLAGGPTEVLASGLNDPHGVAVDAVAGKVYWAEYGGDQIKRANLDGSNVELFLNATDASKLIVDVYAGLLFWAEYDPVFYDGVHMATLGGVPSNNEFGLAFIPSVARHFSSGSFFVASCQESDINCSAGRIYRSYNSNFPPQLGAPITTFGVDSLAIDPFRYRLYWATYGFLRRATLHGKAVQALPTGPAYAGYLTLDPVNQKLYWSEPQAGRIQRADLDGFNLHSFKTGLSSPAGIAVLPLIDCDNNGIDDICDVICGAPGERCDVPGCGQGVDLDKNGLLDVCQEDCNGNGTFDVCEVDCDAATVCSSGPCETEYDCNQNYVIDDCEGFDDCNANSVPDLCDVEEEGQDCNHNQMVDSCENLPDCNGNNVPDECDLAGTSLDCNSNNVPDECDISLGTSLDCNANQIPDDCEAAQLDCNGNGIPDECDITSGFSQDQDANGIPDECCPPPCIPEPLIANSFGTCAVGAYLTCDVEAQNCPPDRGMCDPCGQVRYLSFEIPANSYGGETAIRIRLDSLHNPSPAPVGTVPDFTLIEGQDRFLNTIPGTLSRCCDPNSNPTKCITWMSCTSDGDCASLPAPYAACFKNLCQDSSAFATFFRCALVGCEPEYRDWSGFAGSTTYATGQAVIPSSAYSLSHLALSCQGNEGECAAVSAPLLVSTERWGNVDCSNSNGGIPNATDIGREVDKVLDGFGAFIKPRLHLRLASLNPMTLVTAQDIGRSVDSVKGLQYPFNIKCTTTTSCTTDGDCTSPATCSTNGMCTAVRDLCSGLCQP